MTSDPTERAKMPNSEADDAAWPDALRPAIAPYWAEDAGLSPAEAAAGVLDRAAAACHVGDTWSGCGLTIVIDTVDERDNAALVTFSIARDGERRTGALSLVAMTDGWVRAEVLIDGARWLTARAELVYEEIEFWPAGAEDHTSDGEAPGRIGKHGTWAQIDSGRWPQIDSGDERWPAIELVEP